MSRSLDAISIARALGCGWLVLVASIGCHHYGWASRPESEPAAFDSPGVAVSTIATSAEWSIDGARLTRTFVETLQRRGLEASWRANVERAVGLRCSAATPPVAVYRRMAVADVRVTCRLRWPEGGTETIVERGSQSVQWGSSTSRLAMDAPDRSADAAVRDALDRLADRIARRLRRPAPETRRRDASGLESGRE
jgi:hypothetical protein